MPNMIETAGGAKVELPTDVREQATTKTSVYRQGELIYDGATGQAVGSGTTGAAGPEATLNGMLKWGIENSSPEELARRKAEGAAPPSQIDKEIIDMLLGQPTVAKMRECLGKLEDASLVGADGLDNGAAALEELEYYVEDLDNALDLCKIQGLPILKSCCTWGLPATGSTDDGTPGRSTLLAGESSAELLARDDPEGCAALRESACGVLAAMLQNNPPVQSAASTAGMPKVILRLLGGGQAEEGWEESVGGLAVARKALLAMSAMVRTNVTDTTDPEVKAAAEANLRLALPRLCALSGHSDDKLRRRSLFVLAALTDSPSTAPTVFTVASAPGSAMPAVLMRALSSDDEDTRTQAERLLMVASRVSAGAGGGSGEPTLCAAVAQLRAALSAAGAAAAARSAADQALSRDEKDPEEVTRLSAIIKWLESAAA